MLGGISLPSIYSGTLRLALWGYFFHSLRSLVSAKRALANAPRRRTSRLQTISEQSADVWLEDGPQSSAHSSRSVLGFSTLLLRRGDDSSHSLKNGVVQSGILKGGSLQSMHAERQ